MANATIASQVQALYVGYLGRAADQGGLDFWTNAIAAGTSTIESVALGFVESAEYTALYAGKTNEELAAAIYKNVLGRDADADGLAFWVGEIANGTVTADTLLASMLNSLGAVDQQVIGNKVFVANAYTAAAGADYSAAAGAKVLEGVNSSAASVTKALGTLPVSTATLTQNLEALQAAQKASVDALANIAKIVGSTDITGSFPADANANGTVTAVELQAYVAGFVEADITTALNTASVLASNTEAALALDRAAVGDKGSNLDAVYSASVETILVGKTLTDARLASALTAAKKVVAEDPAAKTAGAEVAVAESEIATHVAQKGTNAQLLSALRDILAKQTLTADYENSGPTIQQVLNEISAALATQDVATTPVNEAAAALEAAVINIGGYAATNAVQGFAGASSVISALEMRATLEQTLNTKVAFYEALPSVSQLEQVKGLVSGREGLVKQASDAAAYLSELTAAAESYAAAEKLITNSDDTGILDVLAKAGFDIEVSANGTADAVGGDEVNDIFVYDGTDGTIANFGKEGSDSIYFGSGYKLVVLGADDVITGSHGSVSDLEIFVKTASGSTTLYVEQKAFAGNGSTDADLVEIQLTGVGAELALVNGYLQLA